MEIYVVLKPTRNGEQINFVSDILPEAQEKARKLRGWYEKKNMTRYANQVRLVAPKSKTDALILAEKLDRQAQKEWQRIGGESANYDQKQNYWEMSEWSKMLRFLS